MVPKQKPISAGFTLVELLVVISIIGLLSSTVLAAVNGARAKADNVAKIRIIQEYKKALDFSYDADGSYPNFIGGTCGGASCSLICLGDYVTDECEFGGITPSETISLSQALERFLPQRPAFKPIVSGSSIRNGPIYHCSNNVFGNCVQGNLFIIWYVPNSTTDCGFSITDFPGSAVGFKIGTLCYYRIY